MRNYTVLPLFSLKKFPPQIHEVPLPPSNPPTASAHILSVCAALNFCDSPLPCPSILHLAFTLAPWVLVTLQTHNYVSGFHAFECVLPCLFFMISSCSLTWHTRMPFCYNSALAGDLVLSKVSLRHLDHTKRSLIFGSWYWVLFKMSTKTFGHLPNLMCHYQLGYQGDKGYYWQYNQSTLDQ